MLFVIGKGSGGARVFSFFFREKEERNKEESRGETGKGEAFGTKRARIPWARFAGYGAIASAGLFSFGRKKKAKKKAEAGKRKNQPHTQTAPKTRVPFAVYEKIAVSDKISAANSGRGLTAVCE